MTDEEVFEWAEPAEEQGRRRTDWHPIADKLRENPGRWARVKGTFSHSIPGFIRTGRMKAFQPPGTFDATLRGSTQRNPGRLYVRYIGHEVDLEWENPEDEEAS